MLNIFSIDVLTRILAVQCELRSDGQAQTSVHRKDAKGRPTCGKREKNKQNAGTQAVSVTICMDHVQVGKYPLRCENPPVT
jgi:hypothetical protein